MNLSDKKNSVNCLSKQAKRGGKKSTAPSPKKQTNKKIEKRLFTGSALRSKNKDFSTEIHQQWNNTIDGSISITTSATLSVLVYIVNVLYVCV